jgi:hypothetical protein
MCKFSSNHSIKCLLFKSLGPWESKGSLNEKLWWHTMIDWLIDLLFMRRLKSQQAWKAWQQHQSAVNRSRYESCLIQRILTKGLSFILILILKKEQTADYWWRFLGLKPRELFSTSLSGVVRLSYGKPDQAP